eukprot:g5014.t1
MCAFTSAIAHPSISSSNAQTSCHQTRCFSVLEHIAQRVVWLCGIAFFLVAELDRARSLRLDEEGHQLRKGFEGSIRFASCSQETDMRNIWEEIGNKVDDVDHAIDVLISAGISSPDLRFAAEQGVDIEEAGHADYAMAVVVLGPLQLISLKNAIQVLLFSPELWQEATFAWLGLLASLSCSIMILGGSVDQRAFILKVMNKLCTLTFIPFAAVMGAVGNEEGDDPWMKEVEFGGFKALALKIYGMVALQVLQVLFTSLHNIKIVVLFFSVLSIRGTLKLPGGKSILLFLLSRRWGGHDCRSRRCCPVVSGSSESDRTKRARGVAVWARHSLRHHVMALPDARTITGDAIAMHEFVSPDRWCVTRLDLQSLRLEVLKAVQSGSIFSRSYSQDTTISQESEDDDEFGPSIYTASSHVLVVPNRHRSVYTRLWCCFEAYVASEEDKTIEIATAPSGFAQRRALLQALVPLTMGLVIGAIGRLTHLTLRVETAVAVFSSICAFVSAYSLRWRRVANYFGLLAAGNLEEFQLLPPVIEEICQRLVWLSAIAFFLVAELDRVRSWHLAEEGQQLRKDFKGSIRFASCTRPGDMMNIWDEIGHKVDAVDNAIDVLISAGISSPALRSAAVKGVDITGAGHADGAISFVVLGPLQLISVKNAIQMHLSFAPTPQAFWWQAIFALIGVMASLICTVLIGVRPVDELALFFAVSGIRGTLALPGGKCILQYFLVRRSRERLRASSSLSESDTEHLQQQLILAIQDGRLQSLLSANSDSEDSEESIDDDHFGPSIYAVNEQYIKPEGIFEFLSKVLASWPSGARNAWCCMLANPQHLNIGCMLQSPKSSPFALALQASRDVLVVPNRHRSVYCRLWCGYEAFVASEDRKVIQVAARPAWRDSSAIVLGVFMSWLTHTQGWDLFPEALIAASLAAFVSVYTSGRVRQAANYLGLLATTCLEVRFAPIEMRFRDLPQGVRVAAHHVTWLSAMGFFLVAEVDRVRSMQIASEGQQLRRKYEGSIRLAACSQQTDWRNIWEEIGPKVEEVDRAIHVLISAGVSSPALRRAAALGVPIEDAGHAELAVATLVLGPLLLISSLDTGRLTIIHPGCIPTRKLMPLVFIPLAVLVGIAMQWENCSSQMALQMAFTSSHIMMAVGLSFALIGIEGTLALPGGQCLVRYFLARQTCKIWATENEILESEDEPER